jgi:hypothetical protein
MKKDTNKTDVIFRIDITKDFKNDIVAILPHQAERNGNVAYYVHVGQHSTGDYQRLLDTSRLATPKEYKDLKLEMERGHGYNFNVMKKRQYSKYLKSYNLANHE